ncbi:hypothetical protein ES708_24675 [subsurface metagenome]
MGGGDANVREDVGAIVKLQVDNTITSNGKSDQGKAHGQDGPPGIGRYDIRDLNTGGRIGAGNGFDSASTARRLIDAADRISRRNHRRDVIRKEGRNTGGTTGKASDDVDGDEAFSR